MEYYLLFFETYTTENVKHDVDSSVLELRGRRSYAFEWWFGFASFLVAKFVCNHCSKKTSFAMEGPSLSLWWQLRKRLLFLLCSESSESRVGGRIRCCSKHRRNTMWFCHHPGGKTRHVAAHVPRYKPIDVVRGPRQRSQCELQIIRQYKSNQTITERHHKKRTREKGDSSEEIYKHILYMSSCQVRLRDIVVTMGKEPEQRPWKVCAGRPTGKTEYGHH